jgi:ferritin-like protein
MNVHDRIKCWEPKSEDSQPSDWSTCKHSSYRTSQRYMNKQMESCARRALKVVYDIKAGHDRARRELQEIGDKENRARGRVSVLTDSQS